ncbi:MAG: hypothetical protein WKF94_19525 [Solirubrobacteraceae bacterium]
MTLVVLATPAGATPAASGLAGLAHATRVFVKALVRRTASRRRR